MFKNYVKNPYTVSPINLALARLIISTYLVWKILSTRWNRVNFSPWPWVSRTDQGAIEILLPNILMSNVVYIQWFAVVTLLLFGIGLWLKYTAYLSSLLVAYLGLIHATVDASWSTHMYFSSSILLMLFALYAEEDKISLNQLANLSKDNINSINDSLRSPLTPRYQSNPLKMFLLALGILYFGGAAGKINNGVFAWVSPTNQMRILHSHGRTGYFPELREIVLQFDFLLAMGGIIYITCQLGFIISIITDKFFNIFIISWIMIHVMTALVMGPIFIYTVVFLCLFIDWEKIISHLQSNPDISVYYDKECFFTIKYIYMFKYFDVNSAVEYYPLTDLPEKITLDTGASINQTIYLTRSDKYYCGYDAYCEILRFTKVLYLLYLILKLPMVKRVIKKIHQPKSTS